MKTISENKHLIRTAKIESEIGGECLRRMCEKDRKSKCVKEKEREVVR